MCVSLVQQPFQAANKAGMTDLVQEEERNQSWSEASGEKEEGSGEPSEA